MEESPQTEPAIVPDGPAFGPMRWRGWPVVGITVVSVAVLYLVQIILGVIVAVITILPFERVHPGYIPDTAFLTKLVFNAPALFAMVIPSEALMAFVAIVLVTGMFGATRANLGLGRKPQFTDFLIGLLAGLALVGVSSRIAAVQEKWLGPHPQLAIQIIKSHTGLGSFALDFVTVALAAGVCEEIMFRGVVFTALIQRMPLVWASVLSGLLFAAAHVDPWSFVELWAVGIGLGLLFYTTRSLWPNMVAHTTFNAFSLVLIYFFPQLAK
jgi:membrane protease YdiL (CAAX protease family)